MKHLHLILILALTGPLPLHAQEQAETSQAQLTLDDLRTFTDVFNQLRTNFVEEVDDHTLLVAAIDGMITQLDPYSAFLDRNQSRALNDTSRGRYGGIGIQVDLRDGKILVDEVTPGGPAEKAGVQPGDLITEVDGRSVRGNQLFESLDAIMGAPDSSVNVRFKSKGEKSRELTLVREFIPVASVRSRLLEGDYGYFEISHFHENSHEDLKNSIDAMQADRNQPLKGVILDLRSNPGGVVRPAVEMADGFLDEGLIVYTKGRYEATRLEFRAHPGQWLPGIPLAILVNGSTASAAEVLAGSLRDHERALLIGEKTFGKGSIQSVFSLRNGSTLKLTTAHYFTPSGVTIHENGIEPDIFIQAPHEGLRLVTDLENDPVVAEALVQLHPGPVERPATD